MYRYSFLFEVRYDMRGGGRKREGRETEWVVDIRRAGYAGPAAI
jgi:hypothetical protein